MESDANSHLTLLPQIIQWGWASENAVDIDSQPEKTPPRRDERNSQSSVRPATSVRMGQSTVLVEIHVHPRDAGTRCAISNGFLNG
jgi:hypothetical protein